MPGAVVIGFIGSLSMFCGESSVKLRSLYQIVGLVQPFRFRLKPPRNSHLQYRVSPLNIQEPFLRISFKGKAIPDNLICNFAGEIARSSVTCLKANNGCKGNKELARSDWSDV